MSREVYGRVYELVLRGQGEREHSYVGKTTTTIHQRVHGKGSWAHTSAQSVAKDPWKARILPGKAGYRQLEVVYVSGEGAAVDEANLRRAEADWIRRLNPEHNDVRPVRPRFDPARVAKTARTREGVRTERERGRRTARRVRGAGLLFLVALFTYLAARVVVAMQLPWPAAPWVAAPTIGAMLGWATFLRLRRAVRKVLR